MANQNRFLLRNDFSKPLVLNIEPEGFLASLDAGDQVTVLNDFDTQPLTLELTRSKSGDPIVTLWPGDGELRVERDGISLLNSE